jgi:hypothetical protein
MQARLLLEVALRLLGLWLVFQSIVGLVTFLTILPSLLGNSPAAANYAASAGISIFANAVIGVFVIWMAPRIAAFFYPLQAGEPEVSLGIGPGDLYHIACFILGIYFVVHGLLMTAQTMLGMSTGMAADRLLRTFLTFSIYVGSGLFLVFGGRRIAEWMAAIKYDPDSVPKQQFSIRLLLIVTLVVALILGIVRIATMR